MSSTTPPAELLGLVSSFLASSGYEKAAKQVQKQAKEQGLTLSSDGDLTAVYKAYQAQTPAATEEKASESSDSDSDSESEASDSDSSSSSESEAEQPSKKRKAASPAADDSSDASSDASSSDSESDSESESEDDAPPAKKSKTTETSSSSNDSDDSSSASSESESSESEDSSSDDSDDESSDSEDDSSSDESDSDSSSDSESDSDSDSDSSDSEAEDKKSKASKKAETKTKASVKVEPKPESSSSSSSATLESDEPVPESTEDTLLVPAEAVDPTEHMHPSRKRKLGDTFSAPTATEAIPATEANVKRLKKENVPFSRIPKDQYVDPKLASNAYVAYDYANKAHEALIVTKGKAFTKAKNKGKRGSYRGGKIDLAPKGIKFED